MTPCGEFAEAEETLIRSESIFKSSGERHRSRHTRSIKALIDLYERWHAQEPSEERAQSLERWRAVLPEE